MKVHGGSKNIGIAIKEAAVVNNINFVGNFYNKKIQRNS